MKKYLPLILSLCCVVADVSATEKLPDSGYYRTKNYKSSRYVYVLDNQGTIDIGASSADLNAIELKTGFDKTISDPATVLYYDHYQDRQYDITCQGTGINKIIDYYVSVRAVSSLPNTYLLYASNSGLTKYLCDGERVLENEEGRLSDNGEGEWRYWVAEPISADSENYFGITPDIDCGAGEYYASFYAAFPFSFASEGMKALYVSNVDAKNGIAVISEAAGTIPGASPVIIACKSATPSGNKLNLGGTPTANLAGNLLAGTYFQSGKYKHVNRVANDKATMRVPALLPDGKLGFVTSDAEYMPRNKAYLVVPDGTPETLQVMTPAEYESWLKEQEQEVEGIDDVEAVDGNTYDIYNVMGVKVGDTSNGISGLAPGVYIINHRKIMVK